MRGPGGLCRGCSGGLCGSGRRPELWLCRSELWLLELLPQVVRLRTAEWLLLPQVVLLELRLCGSGLRLCGCRPGGLCGSGCGPELRMCGSELWLLELRLQ